MAVEEAGVDERDEQQEALNVFFGDIFSKWSELINDRWSLIPKNIEIINMYMNRFEEGLGLTINLSFECFVNSIATPQRGGVGTLPSAEDLEALIQQYREMYKKRGGVGTLPSAEDSKAFIQYRELHKKTEAFIQQYREMYKKVALEIQGALSSVKFPEVPLDSLKTAGLGRKVMEAPGEGAGG